MAKWSGSGSTLTATVEPGDTLSGIAATATKKLGKKVTYQQLASWNGIKNPNLIYDDQKIKCYKSSSSSGGSGSKKKPTNCPIVTRLGPSSVNSNQLIAEWTWGDADKRKTTASYKVQWAYATAQGRLYEGTETDIPVRDYDYNLNMYSFYDMPEYCTRVRFRVKPIAKKKKDAKGNETNEYQWTANWSERAEWNYGGPPEKPSAPSLEVEGSTLTMTSTYDVVEDSNPDDGYSVTAHRVTHIEFQYVKNNTITKSSGKIPVKTNVATYSDTVDDNSEYKVRARAYLKRTFDEKTYEVYSDWSDYSNIVQTRPGAPGKITTLRAETVNGNANGVYIAWSKVDTAEKYEIQYTTDTSYFVNSPSLVKTETVEPNGSGEKPPTSRIISDLDPGKEYFFRIRALRGDVNSEWTDTKSIVIGTTPSPPTTWSSVSTAIVGEAVTLYWVHNSQDASKQTSAMLELVGVSGEALVITLGNEAVSTDYVSYTPKEIRDDESEPTYECTLKTGSLLQGAEVKWRVCTAGIKLDDNGQPKYSEWSTSREIDVYSQPVAIIDMLSEIESFPIDIALRATVDKVQSPTGFLVTITADEDYETTDNLGDFKMVKAGDEVYSNYFNPDINGEVILNLLPSSVTLENGMSYTVICTASMSSGLTAVQTQPFSVSWTVSEYEPNAEIGVNLDSLTASIRPYCQTSTTSYYRVSCVNFKKTTQITNTVTTTAMSNDGLLVADAQTATGEAVYRYVDGSGKATYYTVINGTYYTVQLGTEFVKTEKSFFLDDDIYYEPYGELVYSNSKSSTPIHTTTDELLYLGADDDGNYTFFCEVVNVESVTDVWLSVYRREYDGRFVEIASNLDGEKFTTVTDPHPALDYARYRIVAADKATGHIDYFDTSAQLVGATAAVIQWDEAWTNFDNLDGHTPVQSALSGSMLKLPYNIDVSDSSDPDTALVEYIGRSHPVGYYGTQLGTTSSWSMVVPKDDIDTLYALRRLARWMGDVYVREPSGSGYWAQIKVSFSLKHNELAIPVSLSISRVEGGA